MELLIEWSVNTHEIQSPDPTSNVPRIRSHPPKGPENLKVNLSYLNPYTQAETRSICLCFCKGTCFGQDFLPRAQATCNSFTSHRLPIDSRNAWFGSSLNWNVSVDWIVYSLKGAACVNQLILIQRTIQVRL